MTESGRRKISEKAKLRWARRGERERMSVLMKEAWTPAMRKQQSDAQKKHYAETPGLRVLEMSTPEAKANCSDAFWRQDEETRSRMRAAMNTAKWRRK